MTLDARLDKLEMPKAADDALSAPLDDLVSTQPAGEADPVQVAGIGNIIRKVIKPKKAAPATPKPAAPTTPAPSPAPQTPPAAPITPQPSPMQKVITPEVAETVRQTVETKAAAGAAPTGKPPDELFNFMRTGLPDDANLFIDEVAKAAGVTKPERVTHREILNDLKKMGYSAKDVDWITQYADNTDAMMRVAKSRELLTATAKMTQELAQQVVANPSPELAAKYHQSTVMLAQISRGVKNIGTDYARALGMMRATPEGDAAALQEFLTGLGGIDDVVAHAGKLAKLDLSNKAAIRKMADLAEKSTFSKAKDIWVTTWINGLLSSPVTHARNIFGNEMFAAIQIPERFVGSLIGKGRNTLVGGDEAIEMAEVVALTRGMMAGQLKALEAFGKAFANNAPVTTSQTKLSEAGATISDFGDYLGWGGLAGRAANLYGKAATLPGRALLAEDEFFKVQGYYMELHAAASRAGSAARRDALAAGKSADEAAKAEATAAQSILDSPPDDINAAAWDAARYMTFTNPLEQGSLAQRFQQFSNSNIVAKMFMPFVRTPVNLLVAGLERTPFAPFTKRFRDAWDAGGIDRDMALARMGVGSSLLTTAGYLASVGRITAAGPGDKGERTALERSGWQPFSFVLYKDEIDAETRKILDARGRISETNDKVFVSFDGLEPLGLILALGASYAEYARYQDDPQLVETVGMGLAHGLANYAMELPYIQGMVEFVQTLTGYGTGEMTPSAVRRMVDQIAKTGTSFLIGGSPAGALSSAQAMVERMGDQTASDSRVSKSTAPGLKGVLEAYNRYRSRVPGLSNDLPVRTNRWGEPIQYGEGAWYEAVSPIRVKQGDQKPVDRVWLEWDLPKSDASRFVSWPERDDMAGIRVELTPEQHNLLKRMYAWEMRDGQGRNVQDALVAVTQDPAFNRMSFGAQQQFLLRVDNQFMSRARTMLVNESPFAAELQAQFEQKKLSADAYGIYSDELR